MKLEVEQIDMEREEEVIVHCHDVEADWVRNVKDAAMGQLTVCGYKDNGSSGTESLMPSFTRRLLFWQRCCGI